jgi:dethiobiotin synthetase
MIKGLFITGTDTGVGKTHISCLLAQQLLGAGFTPIPRKPVESGCSRNADGQLVAADARALMQACEYPQPQSVVCPYPLQAAISPAEAARLQDESISLAQLQQACALAENETQNDSARLLVEGAGGFYSPLCADGLNADLAQRLKLPVLLVAEDKLGCINHILLSLQAIESRGLEVFAVVLNQINPASSAMNNAAELSQLISQPLIHSHGQQADLLSAPLIARF